MDVIFPHTLIPVVPFTKENPYSMMLALSAFTSGLNGLFIQIKATVLAIIGSDNHLLSKRH